MTIERYVVGYVLKCVKCGWTNAGPSGKALTEVPRRLIKAGPYCSCVPQVQQEHLEAVCGACSWTHPLLALDVK